MAEEAKSFGLVRLVRRFQTSYLGKCHAAFLPFKPPLQLSFKSLNVSVCVSFYFT
jgi:hypothetical protein